MIGTPTLSPFAVNGALRDELVRQQVELDATREERDQYRSAYLMLEEARQQALDFRGSVKAALARSTGVGQADPRGNTDHGRGV